MKMNGAVPFAGRFKNGFQIRIMKRKNVKSAVKIFMSMLTFVRIAELTKQF